MLTAHLGGMQTVRSAVRNVLVVVGIAVIATAGSVATSSAGVIAPTDVMSIQPAPGQKVGVAMPVTVTFAQSVINRAAAERTIAIASPATPAGSFTWLNDRVVQWNPKGFWPAHSSIIVTAGGAKTTFETGAAVVGVADIDAHTFTVSIDDQVVRQMPASMGKPKYPTPIGTFAALEKQSVVVMDSRTIGIPLSDPEGYRLTVEQCRACHLGRRLCALRPVVGRLAGQFERQPRLHQSRPRQRGLVLRHRQHRRPDHRSAVACRFFAVGDVATVAESG